MNAVVDPAPIVATIAGPTPAEIALARRLYRIGSAAANAAFPNNPIPVDWDRILPSTQIAFIAIARDGFKIRPHLKPLILREIAGRPAREFYGSMKDLAADSKPGDVLTVADVTVAKGLRHYLTIKTRKLPDGNFEIRVIA